MGYMNDFKDIRCLNSVLVDCLNFGQCQAHNFEQLASLVNLKKLFFRPNTAIMSLEDVEMLPESLKNLEKLDLVYRPLLWAIPLARRLPKLRIIGINNAMESNSNIDLKALNNDRMQLPYAKVLKIYMSDECCHSTEATKTFISFQKQKINSQ